MFYLDANEEAVRTRFNTLSLYLLIFLYLLTYYLLDASYKNAWYGFPISIFTFILIRFFIHRKRGGSGPAFYNNKSKAIKLSLYTAFCVFCFFSIQYGAHYPVLRQHFTAGDIVIANYTEYSKDGSVTKDLYWSFHFTISGQSLLQNKAIINNTELTDMVTGTNPQQPPQFTGCGCGVEFGPWGDIVINPSSPFKFWTDRFGVDGVKLPTWLCLCYSQDACEKKYINASQDVNFKQQALYYRIVGDAEAALKNTKCPPDDMNFLQVYREDMGVPAHDEVVLTFLFAFSTAMASSSILLALGFVHLTENYGNRITFVVLISVAAFSLEFSVMSIEDFKNDVVGRLLPFLACVCGSGYIYIPMFWDKILEMAKAPGNKFMRIFKDDADFERTLFKIGWTLWKIVWFVIGIFWAIVSLIALTWFIGRCKIFALKPFRLSEEKYAVKYDQKTVKRKNMLFNLITVADAVMFRGGEGVFLLHLLVNFKAKNELVMTVTFVFVLYEFTSLLYPLIKQVLILRGINTMLESLHPRYYNVAVVRKERALKNALHQKEKRVKHNENNNEAQNRGASREP